MRGDLKLGVTLGYWAARPPEGFVELAQEAERLGYDSVWTAEAYGSDAFTPLAWVGAHTSTIKLGTGIAQISARTPAATAMHAATLDHLSKGRVLLGLGVSGPQVVEGWYGQPFAKPLARTREYVDVIRQFMRREGPITNAGPHYPMPLQGGLGLGKALKPIIHPYRADMPIYLAAEGPKNVALAAEITDGWMPIFYSPYRGDQVYGESLKGAAEGFQIPCPVPVAVTDDISGGLAGVKAYLSFYIGGMGAPSMNFHFDVFERLGFGEEANHVRALFAEGRRAEAAAAVPDLLADEVSLVGSPDRIKDRLQAWIDSPVTVLVAGTTDIPALRILADCLS
jgi:F420-dependent oxidoreductase-like protein